MLPNKIWMSRGSRVPSIVLLLVVLTGLGLPGRATGQSLAPPFDASYTLVDLGSVPGVPGPYGGLTFKAGDPKTLLIGGSANTISAAIYSIAVTRDASNKITGFAGTASFFAHANGASGGIDGGLSYGPGGVLFYTSFSDNRLGQIKPGSTGPDKLINLSDAAIGIAVSVGTLVFVPAGFPGAGKLKIVQFNPLGSWYDVTLASDGSGTFDITKATSMVATGETGEGPEGIIYVAAGNPQFSAEKVSVLVSEYAAGRVSAYEVDSNGDPQTGTRRDFIIGLRGAEGAVVDPLTGDFLFSTFGGGNKVMVVRGFLPVANAGPDQTVDEGGTVSLDGSASSGQSVSYAWSQVAGPPVTLSDASSPTPSFTAPTLPGGVGGNQTLTFKLTVTNAAGSSDDTVDVTVRNVDHPPVADAGPDQTVREGSRVTLTGGASFDPDGDPITYQWTQTGGIAVTLAGANTAGPTFTGPTLSGGVGGTAALTFELMVFDGALSSTDTVHVTVEQDNHSPTANAGPDQTKTEGSLVALDGTGSTDPDGDLLTYKWTQTSGPVVILSGDTTPSPIFTAPSVGPGGAILIFQLVVSDGPATSDPDEVTITVRHGNGPPSCGRARADRAVLWPPNHKLIPVRILGVTDPANDQVAITITDATQDEPVNGLGDGDTSPDAVLYGEKVLLRAERSGTGNGRVYRVFFSADDGHGGTCTGSVTVGVPRSMKHGLDAVDDGQLYNSTLP